MGVVGEYPKNVYIDNVRGIVSQDSTSLYHWKKYICVLHNPVQGYIEDMAAKIK